MAERRGEAGATSVVVLALCFALGLVAWGSGSVVAVVVAHRTAQNAADLAALAGAHDLAVAGAGCSAADGVATANHARLASCTTDGADVVVDVVVAIPFGMHAEVHARARAGPG